ncbi:MAG TPA: AarF/ABC1/UbiB kinase family protein [Solirubrobacteraceae bacterium]|nr:AarF/ABC1/UbiB kinase family protein [Solirubrobacteraceae bacterium]
MPPRRDRAPSRGDAQALALTEELGAQLGRMKGAGAKLLQLLSMLAFQRERSAGALGALRAGAAPVAFDRVRRILERELDAPIGELFSDFDEEPFALASLGQVHRARTDDGVQVAVKVQRPGVAEAIEADLRNLGLVSPILRRLAPGIDAAAFLAEVRELISDELDHELEAQHQRRIERRLRGHPDILVARVHTGLSTRRVLVTDDVQGLGGPAIARLPEAERDRVGELVFRFYLGLAWRDGIVAGDPHADNCVLCPDGRVCLLDFGLVRELEPDCVEGERGVMHAIADGDAQGVHDGLSRLSYLPDPDAVDPDALLEHLATAGEWLLAPGFRRLGPEDVDRTVELGYPPRSPWFAQMRRMSLPAPTLLLRRMELQVLSVLGDLRAGADWGALAAEHHAAAPVSTDLGREDRDFFARRAR